MIEVTAESVHLMVGMVSGSLLLVVLLLQFTSGGLSEVLAVETTQYTGVVQDEAGNTYEHISPIFYGKRYLR